MNKSNNNHETNNGRKPMLDKISSFKVATYSLLDKDVKYCHWSEGLNMIIKKNDVTISLNSEEIQEIIKSLPRTVGGCYWKFYII